MQFGPAAPSADLSLIGTPQTIHLNALLIRIAHLLAPTEPAEAVVDILHSRVADDPDWGKQATALHNLGHRPRLASRWPLPDSPTSALRRTLTGHTRGVAAVAVAPDSTWLATGSQDTTVRIWDVATWQERATLTGHTRGVTELAVEPDGTWLATGGWDGTMRIWDVATWHASAMIRVDSDINACAWLGTKSLSVGGSAGLYLFDFSADAISPAQE
jgi:WD40 repeat protein